MIQCVKTNTLYNHEQVSKLMWCAGALPPPPMVAKNWPHLLSLPFYPIHEVFTPNPDRFTVQLNRWHWVVSAGLIAGSEKFFELIGIRVEQFRRSDKVSSAFASSFMRPILADVSDTILLHSVPWVKGRMKGRDLRLELEL
jgi:hypothetical protein